MFDPTSSTSSTIADCSCPLCRRAASLDAMRHIEAARASASPVTPDADPWHEPDQLRCVEGLAVGLPLSAGVWLTLAVATFWLWARLT